MARPLRHNEAGSDYHAYNRGVNGQVIFCDDQDRQIMVRYLVRTVSRHEVEVLMFCLMGNHLHLVLRCHSACLDVFMRDLMSAYVRYFNARHGVEGRLCRDRYQSKPVQSTSYLATLGVYVHRNPKDLGYADRLAAYPWSSLRYLLSPDEAPWWLNPRPVLEVCGGVDGLVRRVGRATGLDVAGDAGPHEIYGAWAVRRLDELSRLLTGSADSLSLVRDPIERSAALILARELTDLPFADLAEVFGYTDESSVRKATMRAKRLVEGDIDASALLLDLRKRAS